jgi:ATP-binding cassette subfamily B (MDR/TAP) protein 1
VEADLRARRAVRGRHVCVRLRSQFGLVSQEPILFATTIRENVRVGRPSASDEDVEKACRDSNAHGFVTGFPNGYNTFVGAAGSQLSGGQKQRIAIARALLRDPRLLLLDEATAALDNESERLVNEAIDKLLVGAGAGSRTSIIIAHRLSSVRQCDQIIVLERGVIVEQGSHDQLSAKPDGMYASLLKLAEGGRRAKEAPLARVALADEEDPKPKSPVMLLDPDVKAPATILALDEPDGSSPDDKPVPGSAAEKVKHVPIRRVFKFAAPDKLLFIPAVFCATINGMTFPVFALLLSELMNVFFLPQCVPPPPPGHSGDPSPALTTARKRVGRQVQRPARPGASVEPGVLRAGCGRGLGAVRAQLLFRADQRQDDGARASGGVPGDYQPGNWFLRPQGELGGLASLQAGLGRGHGEGRHFRPSQRDCDEPGHDCDWILHRCVVVDGLQSDPRRPAAFVASWKLSLVVFAIFPVIALSGGIQMYLMLGLAKSDQSELAEAAQTLSEAIAGIRTVTAFEMQSRIGKIYFDQLAGPMARGTRKGFVGGAGFGLSQAIMFFAYALCFWYGSTLIANDGLSFKDMNQALFGVLMSAMALGQAAAMTPDIAKGQQAVTSIFSMLDRQSKIDPFSPAGDRPSVLKGDLVFDAVTMAYPTRYVVGLT